MKNKLIYVEQKSGNDSGVAWIGVAGASKTGTTVYSNGLAFKRLKGGGISGNYFDIETGDEYWISGIKKNNQDRHWAGGGDILIDQSAVDQYLKFMGFTRLPSNLIPADLAPAKQQSRQADLEHRSIEERNKGRADSTDWVRTNLVKRKI